MNQKPTKFEYKIRPGDTLSSLVLQFYMAAPGTIRYKAIIEAIKKNNPHIEDPNFIKAEDILVFPTIDTGLDEPQQKLFSSTDYPMPFRGEFNRCTPENPLGRPTHSVPRITTPFISAKSPTSVHHPPFSNQNVDSEERDLFWALTWLASHSSEVSMPANIFAGSVENLLDKNNLDLIESVSDSYAAYRGGSMSRGQYDYARKKALDTLSNRLGPTEKWLFNGRTSKESIRIARGGGVPATQHIKANAARLAKLAKTAKYGGVVLTGVGLAASCYQVANTTGKDEKNDIIVESLASTAAGGLIGVGVGLFLVSNPIGWGTAIVIAAGSAVTAYTAGKIAKGAYDYSGRPVDLHSGLGIDRVCK